ncbi:MAG TPA: amidoligase family protein [Alphaproteobacteria bacterium]|nr:amidoligase family protein [Alphaproteobacteria bacterium]
MPNQPQNAARIAAPAAPGPAGPFAPLPRPRTASGQARRIGVEVEFFGIDVHAAARALAAGLGGKDVVAEDAHAIHIADTSLGRLTVELDLRDVHPQRRHANGRRRLSPGMAARLGRVLSPFVPREMITAPLPVHQLEGVDRAIGVLRAAGAGGKPPFGSLGLHFNVDLPDKEPRTIVAALKAYMLLSLEALPQRNLADRLLAGFRPAHFPDPYVRRVLAPDYWPDPTALTDDYLAANPTRDRGLDLLPLLLHLDEGRVRARLPHEKIGGRPVFHYRQPRARVGEPGWSIAPAWNAWVAVEALAQDGEALGALGQAYLGGGAAAVRRIGPRLGYSSAN